LAIGERSNTERKNRRHEEHVNQLALGALQVLMGIVVPALIAFRVPRRWRLWTLAAWALLPLFIALLTVAFELASGKADAAELDKLVYGLLLIGSFLVLPWLLACGCGYAIGAVLRKRIRSRLETPEPPLAPAASTPQPEPQPPPPLQPLTRSSDVGPTLTPGGWQAAHVGFAHDDLALDGLRIWSLPWQRESSDRVSLAHPAHPTEQHGFTIYNVHDDKQASRFAAAELSNGVWGFYRWVVPADVPVGSSADGALRFEHDLGPSQNGRFDSVAPVARLVDARSGALQFDGSDWASSRVVPQTNGTWLLALDHGGRQTIFRIDPAAGTFIDLSLPGAARPLTDLCSAAATARAECDDPDLALIRRRVAPDGSLKVELQPVEWSNSHWVYSPRVVEIATGRVWLDLWGTDWDATIDFPRARTVGMNLRRYHVGGALHAELTLEGQQYRLRGLSHLSSGPLQELAEALERVSRQEAALAGSRPLIETPRVTARSWMVALLIAVGAITLIAAATAISLQLQGEAPPRKLDTVPRMPGD
jgi:hypothetical protein